MARSRVATTTLNLVLPNLLENRFIMSTWRNFFGNNSPPPIRPINNHIPRSPGNHNRVPLRGAQQHQQQYQTQNQNQQQCQSQQQQHPPQTDANVHSNLPQGTMNPLPAAGIKRQAANFESPSRPSKTPIISAMTGGQTTTPCPSNDMAIPTAQPTTSGGTLGSNTAYTIGNYQNLHQFLVAPQPPSQKCPPNCPKNQPMVSIPFDSVLSRLAAEAAQHVRSAFLQQVFAMQDKKIRGLSDDVGVLRVGVKGLQPVFAMEDKKIRGLADGVGALRDEVQRLMDEVRELRKEKKIIRARVCELPQATSPVRAGADSGRQDSDRDGDDCVILEDAHGAALYAASVSAWGGTGDDGRAGTDGD
ncbi:hypothetical protein B0T19DRAFT_431573 [Cercophora scortea]|uniref:Uncharacterized protein n=1 Tax=Cercophora scortea TaxID=314031 RepID=A0AAE0I9T2_9PEZI|nr:hypothetical protein B0T19DRAFT_431573 [Cercophora scortea]